MKDWTENDSEAMFRQPSDTPINDDHSGAVDNSEEARRRRRFPFEGNSADAQDRGHSMRGGEDDHG
jgi:hypothetical protein